ncbi:hypothetical protein GcC1_053032 [Golovinomyces cichoracearum]|uniref:Uncharacterized protein n=1 Tax=Golovinomyces cichoracearum TaxID=62708 RepID=A0A420IW32_9PEZI|nr:hypothetical protein GcC1_053032 [Golovinomyces cichoracearum]
MDKEAKIGTAPAEVGKLDYPPERNKRREPSKLKRIPKEARPFRLNTAFVISNQQTRFAFQSGIVQADQGSDLNLISNSLVKDLKLERRSMNGLKVFSMQTADGSITPLNYFAVLVVVVGHVFRKIHALIRPEIPGQPDSTNLLLGLPWLYSVNPILAIRDFTITYDIKVRSSDLTSGCDKNPDLSGPNESPFNKPNNDSPRPNSLAIIPYAGPNAWQADILKWPTKKFPCDLSRCLWPTEFSHCKVLHFPSAKQDRRNIEFLSVTTSNSFNSNCNIPFPTLKRPFIRELSETPIDIIKEWFTTCGIKIGTHLTGKAQYNLVLRLMYAYRDLHADNLEDMPPTDLYVHKIKLKAGTKQWSQKKQKRWPADRE